MGFVHLVLQCSAGTVRMAPKWPSGALCFLVLLEWKKISLILNMLNYQGPSIILETVEAAEISFSWLLFPRQRNGKILFWLGLYRCDNTPWPEASWGSLFGVQFIIDEFISAYSSQSRREGRAGTWTQKQRRPWRSAPACLVQFAFLSTLGPPARGGPSHCGLSPPTPIIHKENAPRALLWPIWWRKTSP